MPDMTIESKPGRHKGKGREGSKDMNGSDEAEASDVVDYRSLMVRSVRTQGAVASKVPKSLAELTSLQR